MKSGTVFVAPFPGATGMAAQFVDSVTFVTLDEHMHSCLVLDPGFSTFKPGQIVTTFVWSVDDWIDYGWTMIET